jgi:hypothetical protein
MMIFLTVVVVLLVGAIILLSSQLGSKAKTRDDLFTSLEQFLGTKREPIEGYENSYMLSFPFDGKTFLYEDIETRGFNDKIYKAFLKLQTKSKVTIQFTEKRYEKMLGKSISATDMLGAMNTSRTVHIPKELSMFHISTNDIDTTNALLSDPKVRRIFSEFKNIDAQGRPSNSIKMIDGMIILEFHSSGSTYPKNLHLDHDIGAFENYIKRLLTISKKLELIEGP